MKPTPQHIQRVYLSITLLNTLAASFIWGINTLFLLDAGLSNAQAFLANAFFTVGQVLFEVPTGIVADTRGRKTSYVLGTLTLAASTFFYLTGWMMHAPFWVWALSSMLLGLGFTFFSGATEAWLVDSLEYANFKGSLDTVFGRAQMVGGAAMLIGSVSGGVIAQLTNLGVPYILRVVLLIANFVFAMIFMKDWGFTPVKSTHPIKDIKSLFSTSFELGLKTPAMRWLMLAGPFTSGVGFYAFYAAQPYLLQLYGDPKAYAIGGVAAALVAGAQIIGGMSVSQVRKFFKRRTSVLLTVGILNVVFLVAIGMISQFWLAIVLLAVWSLLFSLSQPVRQAYFNGLIPSKQRATVLSFDSMLGSSGGAIIQPGLGRVADVWSYSASFVVAGVVMSLAVPLTYVARLSKAKSDAITQ